MRFERAGQRLVAGLQLLDNDDRHAAHDRLPRASQYLVIGAKARAILAGRYVASVEDVRALARPVLRHRVLPNFTAESDRPDRTESRMLSQAPGPGSCRECAEA